MVPVVAAADTLLVTVRAAATMLVHPGVVHTGVVHPGVVHTAVVHTAVVHPAVVHPAGMLGLFDDLEPISLIITKQKSLVVQTTDRRADLRAEFTCPATAVPEVRAEATRLALAVRLEGPITVAATPLAVPLAAIIQHPAEAVLAPCIMATMRTILQECQ